METDNTEMVAQGGFGGTSTFLGSPFRTPGALLPWTFSPWLGGPQSCL